MVFAHNNPILVKNFLEILLILSLICAFIMQYYGDCLNNK